MIESQTPRLIFKADAKWVIYASATIKPGGYTLVLQDSAILRVYDLSRVF